jgi:hypothetical protein
MQVEDWYQRFAELQTMANNGWQLQASAKNSAAKKRPKKVRQPVATKSSGLQDFLREIKAEKMRSESSTEVEAPLAAEVPPPPSMTPS